MRVVLADFKLLIEPSSAVAVAAVMAGKLGSGRDAVGIVLIRAATSISICARSCAASADR